MSVRQALVLHSQTEEGRAGRLPNPTAPLHMVPQGRSHYLGLLLGEQGGLEAIRCHERRYTCSGTDEGVLCVPHPGQMNSQ